MLSSLSSAILNSKLVPHVTEVPPESIPQAMDHRYSDGPRV